MTSPVDRGLESLRKHFSNFPESDNEKDERRIYALVLTLIDELESTREQLRWRDPHAELPQECQSVLVEWEESGIEPEIAAYVSGEWCDGNQWYPLYHVYRWRPIPEAAD